MSSKIEEGVYRRPKSGKVEAIQIDLNRAARTAGNGINVMPAQEIPNVNGQEVAVTITRTAWLRLRDQIDELMDEVA